MSKSSEYPDIANKFLLMDTSEPYPCKFEEKCRAKGKFDPEKYACTHGGGVGCSVWCHYTDEFICPKERLRHRVYGYGGSRP